MYSNMRAICKEQVDVIVYIWMKKERNVLQNS